MDFPHVLSTHKVFHRAWLLTEAFILQQMMHDDELMFLEFTDLTLFLIALKQLPSQKERMSF